MDGSSSIDSGLLKIADDYGVSIPKSARRLIEAGEDISKNLPATYSYNHSILCMVSLPRSKVDGNTFERRCGPASLLIEAGRLWDSKNQEWIQQIVPYGTTSRLLLIHLGTAAKLSDKQEIDLGKTAFEFLERLGLGTSGREYSRLKLHMKALAACSMSLGYSDTTSFSRPVDSLTLWEARDKWDGSIRLSDDFFDGLRKHGVPLHPKALESLSDSTLKLDIYCWLSYRLHALPPHGQKIYWTNFKAQFGHEYKDLKNFKHDFRKALRSVCCVYPNARIEPITGGFHLYPSPPPIEQKEVEQ
jgi:hypothetical protein